MCQTLTEHIHEHLDSVGECLEYEDLIVLEDRHGNMCISDIYEAVCREGEV